MIIKVIGIILALIGFLILKFFPDFVEHQREGFTLSGIFIAILMILIGAAMVWWG